jgi:Flp pilus assembly pilin Flp
MQTEFRGDTPSYRQHAQNVIEYGIIVATIAIVVLLGVTAFGNQIKPWFEQLASHITTAGT